MTTTTAAIEAQATAFRECFDHLKSEIGRVFVGQGALVEQLLLCFFCQGHALIEGTPGLGKTLLVRTLAEALSLRFARVQCTPDLMPADVTGTNVLVETPPACASSRFSAARSSRNVVLADEINRATPRTQSAFLEAMQERHVTVFGVTHPIDAALLRVRHAEPDRDGRHLPAAGGAARSLLLQARRCRCPASTTSPRSWRARPATRTSGLAPRFGADTIRRWPGSSGR